MTFSTQSSFVCLIFAIASNCNGASPATGATFEASYELPAVTPDAGSVSFKLPVQNLNAFPVVTSYMKVSCSCTTPLKGEQLELDPGESKRVDFRVELPSRPDDVRVAITIYGWQKGKKVPEGAKITDALVLSKFQLLIPVRETYEFKCRAQQLEVRVGKDVQFEFINRSGEIWDECEFESSLSSISIQVENQLVGPQRKEQIFSCRVIGLEDFLETEDRPRELGVKVFRPFSDTSSPHAYVMVAQHTLRLEFSQEFQVRPKVLLEGNPNSYVTINCARGNARSLEQEVRIMTSSNETIEPDRAWQVQALSDHWLRINLNLAANEFQGTPSIFVSLPDFFWKEEITFRRK